jgi:hypothetical protein
LLKEEEKLQIGETDRWKNQMINHTCRRIHDGPDPTTYLHYLQRYNRYPRCTQDFIESITLLAEVHATQPMEGTWKTPVELRTCFHQSLCEQTMLIWPLSLIIRLCQLALVEDMKSGVIEAGAKDEYPIPSQVPHRVSVKITTHLAS